jgi:hypothetical protein
MVTMRTAGYDIHNFCVLPTQCVYVFCADLRTNSDLCHLQYKLIGFYNRAGKRLQRGKDWVFKLSRSKNKQRLVPLTA